MLGAALAVMPGLVPGIHAVERTLAAKFCTEDTWTF
jgi:hypothetical protein